MSTADPFRDRYAVQNLGDGGIVIDLTSGNYSRLNPSATLVCEALVSTDDPGFAAQVLAERFAIDVGEAAQAVESISNALLAAPPRRIRRDPFQYGPSPNGQGYLLGDGESPKLWVSADGRTVRLAAGHPGRRTFDYLRALAPKVIFLRDGAVLHGAACRRAGGLAAFCGDSGAGKTTTARAFDAAGEALFAEDMLVAASHSPLRVHVGGEAAIRAWATEGAERLKRTSEFETSGLQAAFAGEQIPIEEIWFIAADKRGADGEDILPKRLGPTDGTLAVMASVFLGATSPAGWRRFLELSASVAKVTPLFAARMPRGLETLGRAAALYRRNSAS